MMMKLRMIVPVLLLIALLTGTGALSQATTDAQLRFVHTIPGAAAIDIYINSQLAIADLDFGEASNYISAAAVEHRITVTSTGTTTALWEQNFTPGAGRAFTLVASSFDDPVSFTAFEDILEPLPVGKARFTTIHAMADGPVVDIVLDDGRPLVLQQSYDQPYGTLDVPVFTYNLVVVPAGEGVDSAIVSLANSALNTSTSHMLLLYGTAASPQATLLSSPTRPETDSAGFVRFVYGVPDSPAVDVFVNDGVLAATLFAPGEGANATDYLTLSAGDYELELRTSGTQDVLASASITVNSGDRITAIALSASEELTLNLLTDTVGTIAPDQTLIRVINAGPDDSPVAASLADGTIIANNLALGAASSIAATMPATQSLILSASGETTSLPELSFYGGVFYDVLAFSSTDLITVSNAALAQTIASAPGTMGSASVAAAAPAQAQPTQAPVAPTAIPQSTLAPVIVPVGDAIAGRVFNLNVDANLHLRQYPDTQALSLATVPFGTILTVNGREGALEEIPTSSTPIPPGYQFVDPASLLQDKRDDLVPEQVWLNVTYDTPDGGTIEAWVRADFVDTREASGDKVPLRDLDMVAANRPGEARNTDITPPPVPENIVNVEVTNLDSTSNLNIRRTPDTQGEVLAQFSPGTIAEFAGISSSGAWVFLRHTAADGTITTGWASIDFLDFTYRGRSIDLDELQERGLLTITDTTTRGEQTIGAPPVVAATPDPTINAVVAQVALDPGANLNLRRDPDVNGEVLAQVPSGTLLIVEQRTSDAQWLRVTYEGITGWVAAQTDTAVFVVLTLNGKPFEIADVPLTADS